ncbi:MAG: IS3 family transposase [Oscillospiraceae bacterium]|nr:IS3 family transposase [Oscillospiraceae bacterium]
MYSVSFAVRLKGQYGTNILLEALNISKGTYHSRILHNDAPSFHRKRYEDISNEVRTIFDESRQCYGADKILAVLQSRGVCTSKKNVLRIMRDLGLNSIRAYAKHDYTMQRRKIVVSRQFTVETPNQIWVGDVAQFMVKGVYFYISVVIDLFSRKVLAHRVSPCCSAKMITSTFKTAYAERGYPEKLVFHSDQGTQYTSAAFRGLLSSYGVTQSFSYPGRPVDNAVAESFFANLKREELYRHEYRSEREFREAVSNYIANYNTVRPHRSNNYKSPDNKEQDFHNCIQE